MGDHVHFPARGLIEVAGPEAEGFLQNLLTNDILRLSDGRPVLHAALLTPQGKLISDMFVWRTGPESFVLDLPASRADDVLRRLTMFKLRAQVNLSRVDAQWRAGLGFGACPRTALCASDPRLAHLGYRFLAPATEAPAETPGAADLFEAARLRHGAPDLSVDAAPEEIFALEGLLDELNGVDFKKGCFPGQENVSRMKRRATTRKKFCRVTFEGAAPAFGAEIRAGDAAIGEMKSSDASQGVGIALLRLDRAKEALHKGEALTAGDVRLTLDPPSWLILPSAEETV
jgi:hypothetical protein